MSNSMLMNVQQKATVEEFLKWPEQKPYLELIHGIVRQKAMPSTAHSLLHTELVTYVATWNDNMGGFTLSEPACKLTADNETHVLLPDLAWFPRDRLPILPTHSIDVAPVLAVEILSPDDRYGDVQDKVTLYLRAGTTVVWVVDPVAKEVSVYRQTTALTVLSAPAVLTDSALPGLAIPLDDLFANVPTQDISKPSVDP